MNISDEDNFAAGPIKVTHELTSIQNVIKDYPKRIVISGVDIDIPVKPARVIGGVWEINSDSANFGLGSVLPGEKGNSVIFAHARANLFLNLRLVKTGMEILVQVKSGQWFTYKIAEIKEVLPNQVEVISQTTDKTLTLFTCSGFADTRRLIVVAKIPG